MKGFRIVERKKLPDLSIFTNELPLSLASSQLITRTKIEVQDILSGRNNRILAIVGPCSAWPFGASLRYACLLKELSDAVSDVIRIVMRVYIQKPRTTKGWTGPVNQPNPFLPPDIEAGIRYSRELMLNILDIGLPIADEALFTHNAEGFIELLSWVAIGARSAEDQEHRIFASAIDCPVGMKNPTSGSLKIGVNSVIAAQYSHTAVIDGHQVETLGNPYAHLVLRGGSARSNYDPDSLREAMHLLLKEKVKNPAILIDVSHDNSRLKIGGVKDPKLQIGIVRNVMQTLLDNPDLRKCVKGFMVESFIKTGSQNIDVCTPDTIDMEGLSITDPCLGFEESKELVLETADFLRKRMLP